MIKDQFCILTIISMHNSLNERFFSFISIFRNDSGIISEKDRNLLSFGVCTDMTRPQLQDSKVEVNIVYLCCLLY